MSRDVTTTVYKFNELSDEAKETAREWWKELDNMEFGSDGMLSEPAETAAKILGIEFDARTANEPKVYWQLHCQGAGASFEGAYSYAKGSAQNIRKEFPQDRTLHAIADGLLKIQKLNGYQLEANISTHGREVHEYAMEVSVSSKTDRTVTDSAEDDILELMRDFARWIYRNIEREYEYHMSNEYVDDALIANEYEFTAEGKIA